jgi:DNA-binding transcriptional regulator YiaG
MTPQEYKDTIKQLGLSQQGAARFLHVGDRTSRRWISGQSRIPYTVELLFDLMVICNVKPSDLADKETKP